MRFTLLSSLLACGISSVFCDVTLSSFPNSLTLSSSFDPIKAAYWTGLPHHRRTPFAVSPDGKSAYFAYLDSSYKKVCVQQVDVNSFGAVGTEACIAGFEAAGLVAQNDGFALMATVAPTGTTDIPPNNYPIVALIRFKNGVEAWRTPLNGPGVHSYMACIASSSSPTCARLIGRQLTATPDANGDLVYSPVTGLYAAYFVVTAYTSDASGHFGDSVQYCDDSGALQDIPSSSVFGCSHNTGIGIEAADEPPYASVCAEDHGAIWLNTDTRYMSGVKIANENTTNGASGEPMGGMSGSYSNLARFPSTTNYIFAWQSRGALNLYTDSYLNSPYTQCSPRWLNHNVAIATMKTKDTLTGAVASSTVGAVDGDSQVNWITQSSTEDHQNIHVAAISSTISVVTWETLTNPVCQPVPLGCTGTYAGTSFQLVDSTGAKVGAPVTSTSVFVSGDIANVGTDKVCWPYVDMVWDLSAPKDSGALVTKISFACASNGGAAAPAPSAPSSTTPSAPVAQPTTSSSATTSTTQPTSAPPTTTSTTPPTTTSTATPTTTSTAQPTSAPSTTAPAEPVSPTAAPSSVSISTNTHKHKHTTFSKMARPKSTYAPYSCE